MSRLFILYCVFILSTSSEPLVKGSDQTLIKNPSDTTLKPFADQSYTLKLHCFNLPGDDDDPTIPNISLTLIHYKDGKRELLFCDSLYSMHPGIEWQDFNNDGTQDILIFNYTGGRANPTYHLYLKDEKRKKLIGIKGFEELPNPELDTLHHIITSIALAGSDNYYSFYRINTQMQLINLGHGFKADLNDSTQYENAIKQILREHKR